MSIPPASGRMSWTEAVAGATCLWQDLDGAAPDASPPTSILWAWRPDSWLVRARHDGDVALVAVHDGGGLAATVPWDTGHGSSPGDLRVAASRGRGPSADHGEAGATYEQVVVNGISDGTGPVTFLRPA
ncbi:MAG: hypothetical protein ACLP52_11815 [Streptosporangiaceae bacterium]|jgi:hypothetical protein